MHRLVQIFAFTVFFFAIACHSRPQGFVAVREVISARDGEVIPVDAGSLDVNGCLVGPSGERVCPTYAVGSANDLVAHRGNKGPGQTGSNGNAGPIDANGRPIDPAAQTYLKQIEDYKRFELEQQANAERQIAALERNNQG